MATLAQPRVRRERIFYTAVNLAVAAVVFAGFARTYYLGPWFDPPARMPPMTPWLHLHAVAFTLWIAFTVAQPSLIASGRPALHRKVGWFASATGFAVWLLANVVSAQAMNIGYRGMGDPHAFYAITFFSIQAFGIILLIAILKRRDAQAHKRLMLLSSAAILEAAFGRLPLQLVEIGAPLSFYLGSELIILAGILHDRATRGRAHAVWIWGGGALVASQLVRLTIMQTGPWLAFAHVVAGVAGPR